MEYKQDYIANNYQLYLDLNNMTYHRDKYICFIVTKPKYREIFCSLFRDRVVDTLIIDKFGEIFESVMSNDAYACRIGKGLIMELKIYITDITKRLRNILNIM